MPGTAAPGSTAVGACAPPVLLQGVVDGELLSTAQTAVAALLEEEEAGGSDDDDPQLLCATHWVPLLHEARGPRLAAPARHVIEQVIGHLCELPCVLAALDLGSALVGAEWWLQEQAPGDAPKELHTDKDVLLELSQDGATSSRTLHPWRSSVLYLSETGGPTAVFEQRREGGRLVPPLPGAVHLAFPRPGRLLLFGGELLHGVLHPAAAQEPTEARPRRTLLVNWWAQPPAAAAGRRRRLLPAERCGLAPRAAPAEPPGAATPQAVERPGGFGEDARQWRGLRAPEGLWRDRPPAHQVVLYPAHEGGAGAGRPCGAGAPPRRPAEPGGIEYDWTDGVPDADEQG